MKDGLVEGGEGGQVVHAILLVRRGLDELFEFSEARGVREIGTQVGEMREEFLLDNWVDRVGVVAIFGPEGITNKCAKSRLIHGGSTNANDREIIADF